jgi:H+/gluconate symporter-like permease
MKALTTQFDDGKLSNTVATPTCCCCCCCCCCLTTSVLATTTLTKSISKNCNENKDDRKPLLVTLAALTIPISLMLSQSFIGILASSASTNYESNLISNFIDQLGPRFVTFLIIYLLMILGLYIISKKRKTNHKFYRFYNRIFNCRNSRSFRWYAIDFNQSNNLFSSFYNNNSSCTCNAE